MNQKQGRFCVYLYVRYPKEANIEDTVGNESGEVEGEKIKAQAHHAVK